MDILAEPLQTNAKPAQGPVPWWDQSGGIVATEKRQQLACFQSGFSDKARAGSQGTFMRVGRRHPLGADSPAGPQLGTRITDGLPPSQLGWAPLSSEQLVRL